jgi:hypothetical protein
LRWFTFSRRVKLFPDTIPIQLAGVRVYRRNANGGGSHSNALLLRKAAIVGDDAELGVIDHVETANESKVPDEFELLLRMRRVEVELVPGTRGRQSRHEPYPAVVQFRTQSLRAFFPLAEQAAAVRLVRQGVATGICEGILGLDQLRLHRPNLLERIAKAERAARYDCVGIHAALPEPLAKQVGTSISNAACAVWRRLRRLVSLKKSRTDADADKL